MFGMVIEVCTTPAPRKHFDIRHIISPLWGAKNLGEDASPTLNPHNSGMPPVNTPNFNG